MVKVYENKHFIILGDSSKRNRQSYILYNKNKDFKSGHTHLNNYKTAMWIMRLYLNKKLPNDLGSIYLLESLLRISDDDKYTEKVTRLIESKSSKSHNYYINVQKGSGKKQKRKYKC